MTLIHARPAPYFLPLLLMAVVPAIIFISCHRQDAYFAFVEGPVSIQPGSPVLSDSVRIGAVENIHYDSIRGGNVLEISLAGNYSIPVNSDIVIFSPDGYVSVNIIASRDYFRPGDTIFEGPATLLKGEPAGDVDEGNISGSRPVYKIQVLASKEQVGMNASRFKGLGAIEEIKTEGLYKYYTGAMHTHAEAKGRRKEIVEMGIADAFIVCFLDGKRISVDEAMKYGK